MDEYAAGRTPNPCLRCNEKIKFAAVLDRALGARLRRGRDRPLRAAAHRRRRADRDAPRRRPRQGPVLRARRAHPGAARALAVPARRLPQVRRTRARPRARGLLVADKPDSHDICFVADGDTAGWLREKLGDRAPNHGGDIVDDDGEVLGAHEGTYALHDRPAQGPADRRARRRTASRATCSTSSRSPAPSPSARASGSPSTGSPAIRPRWCGTVPDAPLRVHRPAARPRRRAPGGRHASTATTVDDRAARPGRRHRARARPPWSTTAPASSARPRSPPPPRRRRTRRVTLGHRRRVDARRRPARVRRGRADRARRAARPAAPARAARPRGGRRP